FSLTVSAAHLDLHSFPTRRSSDLEDVDEDWRRRLEASPLRWASIANMDWLLGLGGIVLVIGGIARRRQFHERLEQMGREEDALEDRKSTRLNSSHVKNSYAVFCLK